MADNFKFELVSPERLLLSESVTEVVIPASEGEMTVMANHAPTMTTIRPGIISARSGGEKKEYVIFGGFADILPEVCTILAESAVPLEELNRDELTRRIEVARKELENADEHDHKSKLEQFIMELTHLGSAVLPS